MPGDAAELEAGEDAVDGEVWDGDGGVDLLVGPLDSVDVCLVTNAGCGPTPTRV
jgi:hypothetical protein